MSNKSTINIVIFGKNGQVASDLLEIFSHKNNFNIQNFSSADVDFTDLDKVKLCLSNLQKVDFIINATAYNAVDKAEDEKQKADLINHLAVKEIANYCKDKKIKFIHYSTNYVFDGLGSNAYFEDNIKNLKPLSIYGKTKLSGEKAIINSGCDYLIFRVATVFNLNKNNNFVAKIKNLAKNNHELKIVDDQITNPTNSYDIANATIKIIERIINKKQFHSQIYHLASKNPLSYYQFAQEIINIANLDNKITPVSSDYYQTKARRPLNGALNCDKIKQDFDIEILNNITNITIIIIAYNSAHIISEALENIVNKGYPIIIVDNASNDNLEDLLKKKYKNSKIKLIKLQHNVGFARANNIALEQITTKYAFLLNPDAKIDIKSLENLIIQSEKNNKIALASAIDVKTLNPTKEEINKTIKEYKNHIKIFAENNEYIETDFICGGFMLLKMSIFQKIGFFDKNIFLYYEDAEISQRSIDNGYKNILVKNSFVCHQISQSTKTNSYLSEIKNLYFRNYNLGWSKAYFKNQKKTKIKLLFQAIKYLKSALFNLILFNFKQSTTKFATFVGMTANLFGRNCFNKNNQHTKIITQLEI